MFTNIGVYHPQVVHFVIALLIVGVIFRLIALTGKLRWTGPAATTLIILGTLASQAAIMTGDKAHPPVERIPGVRDAVVEHEEWADRTRSIFIAVSILEIAGLVLLRKQKRGAARAAWAVSGLVGLLGLGAVFETGEHGGAIVYTYGGGPGLRSGDPQDVTHLYVAGLYNQAMLERKQGKKEDAARHITELGRVMPNDPSIPLLLAESKLRDQQDGRGALDAIAQLPPAKEPRQTTRRDLMRVEAYLLLGQQDSARAVMNQLKSQNPDNPMVKHMADSLHL